MSSAESNIDVMSSQGSDASVGDFVALMKPRVMSLVVFTALVGMVAAPGDMHPVLMVASLLCITVGAGASGALNMWYDADIDSRMARTASRPIPRGRVTPQEALSFGAVLSGGSVLMLGLMVNWLSAGLLALTIFYYIFIYTMWLKRSTPQNIVVGGAAGAFPPMIGWAAATGTIGLEPIVLFLIIFMWTPPHFWALALVRYRDYKRVEIPMLPVVAGAAETRKQILIYSLILIPLAFAPSVLGFGGWLYTATNAVLGAMFLWYAIAIFRSDGGTDGDRKGRRLFGFSILYLFAIFAALLVEHGIGASYFALTPLLGG